VFKFITLILFISGPALAYKNGAFYFGVGYYSQNILGKTTTSSTSAASPLGAPAFPLNFKYDWSLSSDWYLSPQFSYTLMPRASAENSAKTTMMHLVFPFGNNFGGSMGGEAWDWFVGPGLIRYSIQGSGGTTVLSNGTGTATFALPGGNSTVQNITFNAGTSYNIEKSRLGFDLIIEGLASSGKRSESLMLSYAYAFSSGGF